MKYAKKSKMPQQKNNGEYWWCLDSHEEGLHPVRIAFFLKKDGSTLSWYDIAGSDEGYSIEEAEWYGKVEIPLVNQ